MSTSMRNDGIFYAATQDASGDANVMDDYEEGTATMTARFGGTSGAANGTGTLGYTKISRYVFSDIYITLLNSIQGSGHAVMTGLPFAVGDGHNGIPYTNDKCNNWQYVEMRYSGSAILTYMAPTTGSTNLQNYVSTNWTDGVGGKALACTGMYIV